MVYGNEVREHLQKHVVYPANKKEVIEACNLMSDVPKEDKEAFERNLPDWDYKNADEIMRTVEVVEHLDHVKYPVKKVELDKACDNMTHVPKPYREWFKKSLPERSYSSRDEVLGGLKGITHIREHVTYPTTKTVIVETCNKMTDVPEINRAWFAKLPDKNYYNSDDVIKALKL